MLISIEFNHEGNHVRVYFLISAVLRYMNPFSLMVFCCCFIKFTAGSTSLVLMSLTGQLLDQVRVLLKVHLLCGLHAQETPKVRIGGD